MRIPTKRSINLALLNVKKINWFAAAPLILLIVAAAAAFAKFGVADQFAAVSRLRSEGDALQDEINALNEEIRSYGALNETYAHYTYSGMTEEELSRVDRVEAMELIRRCMMDTAQVGTWAIHENVLTVTVTADTLQTINDMSQRILDEDIVDFCTVSNARMENAAELAAIRQEETVQATVVIYLKIAGGEQG